jgi:hypothetical protein
MGLEHLDTLIAFSFVMLGLSLLVTIAVQAINVCMQNRGNLLKWGLKKYLIETGRTEKQADDIAIKILSDPSLSPNGRRLVSHLCFEELLLLLPKHDNLRAPGKLDLFGFLTSGLFNFLDSSKARVFQHIRKGTVPKVTSVADKILDKIGECLKEEADQDKETIIAIAVDEMKARISAKLEAIEEKNTPMAREILDCVCNDAASIEHIFVHLRTSKNAKDIKTFKDYYLHKLEELERESNKSTSAGTKANDIGVVGAAADTIVNRLKTHKTFAAFDDKMLDEMKKDISENLAAIQQTADKVNERLGTMFQLFMDRTTERFIAHSRIIAIVISFLLCFLLQVDSLKILEQLATDGELRTKLVLGADAALDRADATTALTDKSKELATDALKQVMAPRTGDNDALKVL